MKVILELVVIIALHLGMCRQVRQGRERLKGI